jgi:hypothetical protein
MSYSICPTCKQPANARTRGIPTHDLCANGHRWLVSEAIRHVKVVANLHVVKRGKSRKKWFVTAFTKTFECPENWSLKTEFNPFCLVREPVLFGQNAVNRWEFLIDPDKSGPSLGQVVAIVGVPRSGAEPLQSGLTLTGWEEGWTRLLKPEEVDDYERRGGGAW